ncbi:uncharacterized protein LOC132068835 [Lycium ferocissimum]|uniref:uncharacterized protein LOC132068835 n=1 Tax=Lycium ferocissimum TaxID=112874 RepID=UPI002815C442|nr:uncharacterized protein LOC132068835 [Lycium ferocissimum]
MSSVAEELPCPNTEVIRSDPCLTYQQKCLLITPISDHEILVAIKGMPHEKAPREKRDKARGPYAPLPLCHCYEIFTMGTILLGLHKDFKFPLRCKKIGMVHICFADDLLMLCKADVKSIQLLQDAFHKFSTASGLQANTKKSSIYV